MSTGALKKYDANRGFDFITPNGGKDVRIFHFHKPQPCETAPIFESPHW
jgi:cold shock CspA family protein